MKNYFLRIILLLPITVLAQNKPIETSVSIAKAIDKITVDGILDETTWDEAELANNFYLVYPVDNDFPISKTEVKMSFDDNFLYVGAICYDPTAGKYLVGSLKRDWDWRSTENFSIYIDPFNDRTNGFNFSVSPYNSQREGLISAGTDVSADWDNKWYSEVKTYEDKWVIEIAIPFKTLRYKSNLTNWNIQFLRNDLKNNQRSAWIAVPQQYRPNNLAYSGKLDWLNAPPEPKVNISVIPAIVGGASKNYEEGGEYEPTSNLGFDAKVGVTSSLNLDITVNPDFSQVEVDQQVVNLQRFELFFPERRQFFLENSDLFDQSGFPPSRPFFSRRIGIAKDTSDNSVSVPIIYGARLSGKINKNWRIGLMNMQTGAHENTLLPGSENLNEGSNLAAQNYLSAVVQRQLWKRSNIGAVFVNRQATNFEPTDTTNATSAFNRVAGIDFNFATIDDKFKVNTYLHASFDPIQKKEAIAQGLYFGYQSRHWALNYYHNYIGEGYNAEVGFVPRKGIFGIGSFRNEYIIYPKSEAIVTIKPGVELNYTIKSGGEIADRNGGVKVDFEFANTSSFNVSINQQYTFLYEDFDPTRSDGVPLLESTSYTWVDGGIRFESDRRKALNYSFSSRYGSFYNGEKFTGAANLGYIFRPFGSFYVSAIYNDVQLPAPHTSEKFWLIGPRLDLTFTNSLFLTTFVQYNEQADNVNINARFQWRFAPVSDLFVVYTDNYFPSDFGVKNRAIVVKLSYWLNL